MRYAERPRIVLLRNMSLSSESITSPYTTNRPLPIAFALQKRFSQRLPEGETAFPRHQAQQEQGRNNGLLTFFDQNKTGKRQVHPVLSGILHSIRDHKDKYDQFIKLSELDGIKIKQALSLGIIAPKVSQPSLL